MKITSIWTDPLQPEAIFEMHPTEAPILDGFNAYFFPTFLAENKRENNNNGAQGVEK